MLEGKPEESDRDRIRRIVAECLENMESSGTRAVDEACEKHPSSAPEIRRRLNRLRVLGLLSTEAPKEAFPDRLGDFQLLGKLGAGGMGIVYHARQLSLSRDVALKVMLPELHFVGAARSRFQREIDAVSRLQHASIVPIYAVGEEKGVPYFAMERIRGCTVTQVLSRVRNQGSQHLTGEDFWRVMVP